MEIILAICVTGSESLEECSLIGKGITFIFKGTPLF